MARNLRHRVRDYMRTMLKQSGDVEKRALWIAQQIMTRSDQYERALLLIATQQKLTQALLGNLLDTW